MEETKHILQVIYAKQMYVHGVIMKGEPSTLIAD